MKRLLSVVRSAIVVDDRLTLREPLHNFNEE